VCLSCAPDPVAQQVEPCDQVTSTCKGNNHLCIGRGRGTLTEFSSTKIIGQRQARARRR